MTKKYSELITFITEASQISQEETKFKYHIEKMVTRIKAAIKKSNIETDYQEKNQDARIENASEDKDGNILRDGQTYKYTKDAEKKLIKQIRAFTNELNDSDIDVEPNILSEHPTLTQSQVDAFKGLLIPEDYEVGLHIETANQNGR